MISQLEIPFISSALSTRCDKGISRLAVQISGETICTASYVVFGSIFLLYQRFLYIGSISVNL